MTKMKKSIFLLFAVLFALSLSPPGFADKGGSPASDNGKGKPKNNGGELSLSSLTINGLSSLDENTSATFTAIAAWSDGSTDVVAPTWSENSAFATINSNGVLTVLEVVANQTVTVTASYTSSGITKTATKSVSIIDITPAAPTLSSLTISGPSSLDENTSASFKATAVWSDGTTSAATPTWSEDSAYAAISAGGVLSASEVTADQTVTVTASYASNGITKTATKSVSIADIPVSSGTMTAVFGDVPGANYPNTVTDTFINLNTVNTLTNTSLNTYTWPTNTPANAILMKWDISALPAGAQILDAKLYLYMNQVSGTGGDSLYDLSVHKIINKNPDLTKASGYTYDGINSWTPNSLAYNGVPLAQKDIAPAADVKSIDKAFGYKSWNVTQIIKDWKATPQNNYGLLLNSDVTASSDSNRSFASSEAADGSQRPKLVITYTLDSSYTPPPLSLSSLVISGPSSLDENISATFSATATWSDGSTSAVTPNWSENSAYATISTGGILTASEVATDQTVTVSASYTKDGVTKADTKSVSILDIPAAAPTLSSLAISGPSSLDENTSASFKATATWSDGSTSSVVPNWNENSAYATISTGGVLTASEVTGDQTVTITASYTSDGNTKTATKPVSIFDVSGPYLPPQVTLAWDRSTDPQIIGYKLYYKESSTDDPSYNNPPFESTGLPEGDSPIDVGLNETFTLSLPYDTTVFCFGVTAYDAEGLESDYSNVVCTGNQN